MTAHGAADTQGYQAKNTRVGCFARHVNTFSRGGVWTLTDKAEMTAPFNVGRKNSAIRKFFQVLLPRKASGTASSAHCPHIHAFRDGDKIARRARIQKEPLMQARAALTSQHSKLSANRRLGALRSGSGRRSSRRGRRSFLRSSRRGAGRRGGAATTSTLTTITAACRYAA